MDEIQSEVVISSANADKLYELVGFDWEQIVSLIGAELADIKADTKSAKTPDEFVALNQRVDVVQNVTDELTKLVKEVRDSYNVVFDVVDGTIVESGKLHKVYERKPSEGGKRGRKEMTPEERLAAAQSRL